MGPLGKQIAIELYSCDGRRLDDVDFVRQAMLGAAREAGARIVTETFHRFSPHGVSGVVIIAESHLAIHTWPEYRYAAADLFTCGDRLACEKAIVYLRESLRAERITTLVLSRGPVIAGQMPGLLEQQCGPSPGADESQEILFEPSEILD